MLCIKACPVDAIVGAAKRMHTVLTQYCTGCELCLAPCPVDCIDMVDLVTLAQRGNRHAAALATESVKDMASIAGRRFGFHEFAPHVSSERVANGWQRGARKLADLNGCRQHTSSARKPPFSRAPASTCASRWTEDQLSYSYEPSIVTTRLEDTKKIGTQFISEFDCINGMRTIPTGPHPHMNSENTSAFLRARAFVVTHWISSLG
jgi:ferredoxin